MSGAWPGGETLPLGLPGYPVALLVGESLIFLSIAPRRPVMFNERTLSLVGGRGRAKHTNEIRLLQHRHQPLAKLTTFRADNASDVSTK